MNPIDGAEPVIYTSHGRLTEKQFEQMKETAAYQAALNKNIIAEHGSLWDQYSGVQVHFKNGNVIPFTAFDAMNMVNGTTSIFAGVERFSGANSFFVEWLNSELKLRTAEYGDT